ncbi:MAG TPA: DUF4339 domain-containing protein [Candidatus Methylacidiphilales bacterium]|nr:DUF4339 domain-containing protein [Candidatus Methylacidiphilales bacterium]
MRIFITKNGQQLGPYTLEQIQAQAAAGVLRTDDWAWYEGITDWIPVNRLPGFSTSQPPPYAPPIPPPTPSASPKRPIAVWIISIFYFITVPFTLLSLALIPLMLSGTIPITDVQRRYFESLNIFDYTVTFLLVVFNLAGALLLFLLRRPAVYCFGAVFVLNLLNYLYEILFKNWLGAIGNGSGVAMIGSIFEVVLAVSINLAVFGYALYLYIAKVLR